MHGQDRHAVVVRQPAQHIEVLADRVHGHHDLDAVISEAAAVSKASGARSGKTEAVDSAT